MKKTMPKTKTMFAITALSAVAALFALVGATCEKAQTAEATQTPQALQEAQAAETVQTANLETGETPAEEEPAVAGEPMSVYDAMLNAELHAKRITEMEMVFVEGGTMKIQGQKISLDSFYISRYVLPCHLYTRAFNWAHSKGYLGDKRALQEGEGGCTNILAGWNEAIAVSNWLSITEGLTPVYWREDMAQPVLSPWDTVELRSGPYGVSVRHHPFFIDLNADGYRLPTEAEWEFAARGGNKSMGYLYAGSNTLSDVLTGNDWGMYYIPNQMVPNELGIHDMSSPASEWVLGPWTEYGELVPLHNPGRFREFEFPQPFCLIQKGGNRYVEDSGKNSNADFITGSSFRPEERILIQFDGEGREFTREMGEASVRLVRKAGL